MRITLLRQLDRSLWTFDQKIGDAQSNRRTYRRRKAVTLHQVEKRGYRRIKFLFHAHRSTFAFDWSFHFEFEKIAAADQACSAFGKSASGPP
jgi:hypothetical protein